MAKEAWRKKSRRDGSFETKRRLVLETAARAFNNQGFYRTSLDDIAAELNVTKAALYYYFKNKDEILYECHTMAISQLIGDPLENSQDHRTNSLEKVEQLVRRYVPMITQSFGRCLVLVGTLPLEAKSREKCQSARREIHDLLVSWIEEGIEEGSIQDCDPKTSASLIFGSLNWIAQWFDDSGTRSIDAVTEDAVLFVHRALGAPGTELPAAISPRILSSAQIKRTKT